MSKIKIKLEFKSKDTNNGTLQSLSLDFCTFLIISYSKKNILVTFWKMNLFLSSGEMMGESLISGPGLPHHITCGWKQTVSKSHVLFQIPDDGQRPEIQF
jgi:hypothetical protein